MPATTIQVNGSATCDELNKLINALLFEDDADHMDTEFDFIIDGQLVRLPLEEHLQELAEARTQIVSAEQLIQIEYIVKERAPKPLSSLQHDDWVASVDANDKYIISASYDGFVHIWTLKGKHKIAIPPASNETNTIRVVRWIDLRRIPLGADMPPFKQHDYAFMFGSHDEMVHVFKWNAKSNDVQSLYQCVGHCRSVDCLDVNCDIFASGSADKMLKVTNK